jgi:glutaconate CoA-transferase subunit B
MNIHPQEFLIAVLARKLAGARHVAVGSASPLTGASALLASELSDTPMRVTILGSKSHVFFTEGSRELFDASAQGRIDAFMMGGGQIDGQANVNLMGVGPYPKLSVRWAGNYGTPYLYSLIKRTVLFREEHTRRVFVPKVDYVSAAGVNEPNVFRPGGPSALVTSLCSFDFDRKRGRFLLESVHPGHTLEEVKDNTGFDFDAPGRVPVTPAPDVRVLEMIRGNVASQIAETYPQFAERLFGVGSRAARTA